MNTATLDSATLDSTRVSLTILYLRNQKFFYMNYGEEFSLLCDWMLEGEQPLQDPIESCHADICGACLCLFDMIPAGRVRDYCRRCHATRLAWRDQYVKYLWPPELAEALRISEMLLQTYLAEALYKIKTQNHIR
jgi:hypothetical protein